MPAAEDCSNYAARIRYCDAGFASHFLRCSEVECEVECEVGSEVDSAVGIEVSSEVSTEVESEVGLSQIMARRITAGSGVLRTLMNL
jgi:hypothetical protein